MAKMNTSKTCIPAMFIVMLRFKLDNDAPTEYIKKWNEFKILCESGDKNTEYIVEQWKSYCKIKSNRKISYLKRPEGGIGGDNSGISKQIIFRPNYDQALFQDKDIVLDQVLNTKTEHWTYKELNDLVCGFITTANEYLCEKCVRGCIELIPRSNRS